ncbi:DUF2953 domain-containing protein [Roseibacterium sp. SDUM158017]|uniref:DUF2953 domain-containing protein n=1 Tax=Roseicyclus salinarum TaxID=3036773 RepID=UPI00241534C8|nr:DUF2953 domain-containing protein [Roseibacterium sp. SDUM158017]MDG4648074.1 DUF2953 domain-containing protein [Roseibacterium sp. SDUM158017]
MTALAWLLGAALALVLVTLLAPWHVRAQGRTSPPHLRIEVRPLAGHAPAIPIPVPLGRQGRTPRPRATRRPREDVRARRLRPAGLRALAFGILRAIRLRHLEVRGRIGLDDPADTGVLWGRLAPFAFALSGPRRRIDVAPDFSEACLDVEAVAELVVRPLGLLRAGMAFGWANVRAPA